MKRKAYLILLILVLLLIPATSFADDLSINKWLVDSTLLENGDLIISEYITFNFKDDFNGVYRNIVLDKTDGIENLEIFEVNQENETPYTFVESAKKGESNVFTAEEKRNVLEIMIFSPSEDELKTFKLNYIVKNVAVRHVDTGELYYAFIGKENKTPIDLLSVDIKLPYRNREETKIFGHGPAHGNINFIEDDLIRLEIKNLPTNTYVEGRILFPRNFIADSTRDGNNTYDKIISEELGLIKDMEEKAIRREKNKGIFNNLSLVVSVIGLAITWFTFNKLRRNVDIYNTLNSTSLDEITPGELRLFYYSSVDGRSLMTIIFDLARKGYIDIGEIESKKKKRKDFQLINRHKLKDGLLSHEIFILDWLFNTTGDGDITSTIEIEDYRKKNFSGFSKDFNQLSKLIKNDLKSRGYYDENTKVYGIVMTIISSILFAVGIISIAFEGFYGVLSLILSTGLFIYGITLFFRKSDKGHIQYQLWKDFRKDVQHQRISIDDYNISIPRDKVLIYALALGFPMKSMDKLRNTMSQPISTGHWAYWYFLTNRSGGSYFEDSLNSSFYGATSSTTSSSIGAGGGFSGGGGGGAGGGGAGGF